MEAHIFQTLSNYEQKSLAARGSHLLPSTATIVTSIVPSLPLNPTLLAPGTPPATVQSNQVVQSFVKASGEIFRVQRQWEESCVILSPLVISSTLPRTWRLITVTNVGIEQMSMIVPCKPFTFAWPVEPSRAASIPHAVAFARCVLEEYAVSRGLTLFELAVVEI